MKTNIFKYYYKIISKLYYTIYAVGSELPHHGMELPARRIKYFFN